MELKKQIFLRLIQRNTGTLKSLCKVYYISSEDQKDAFQDIVLQLWKSFETFRGEADIDTWIYRVSLNTILGKIRKEKKSVTAESIEKQHMIISNANANDDLELLTMIVHSLKDIDKAIVILYLEGYRNKEIAEILKLTPTNVATRFNRIKTQLRMKFKSIVHAARRS